jgi:cyclopropane-fatty-acyl-phospholipid synthase
MSLASVLPFAHRPGLPVRLVAEAFGRRLAAGELTVRLPDSTQMRFHGEEAGPRAALSLRSPRALRRLLLGGEIGLAESYVDGDWDSPDLVALLELGARNAELGAAMRGGRAARLLQRLRHRRNDNTRRGSRRNIATHYDLGNQFYRQWLDPSMTYSAALFAEDGQDLEAAQQAKYRAVARDLGLRPGQRVLEIGCGWGGFAELAAREFGAHVIGLTLSVEQKSWADERIRANGLDRQVEIRLQDYRDVAGRFDHIVSIEMIEAVGERWWPAYFATLKRCLGEGGRALLQAIVIEDRRFDAYRRGCDFIQRHVFPGGMLPSPAALAQAARQAGLRPATLRRFGAGYDRTLALWSERFHANWERIAPLGFDQRFRRLWDFYFAYCRAGFRAGAIDVHHVALDHA